MTDCLCDDIIAKGAIGIGSASARSRCSLARAHLAIGRAAVGPRRLGWTNSSGPTEIPFPKGNPYSEAKAKLGRMIVLGSHPFRIENPFVRHLP